MNINKYLDEHNRALWEEIENSDIMVSVIESYVEDYVCRFADNKAFIYVPYVSNIASFTHELLHVQIYKDKIYLGSFLRKVLSERWDSYFEEDTIGLIVNCMEHIKMLPRFLSMGYDNSLFISDYKIRKFDDDAYKEIKKLHHQNHKMYVNKFLRHYIAMRADNNPEHNYDSLYYELECLDKDLYIIVKDFWDQWELCDLYKENNHNYENIIQNFILRLSEYIYHYNL